jgi:hypothetical protein
MHPPDPQLQAAHARSSMHRAEILASEWCGCFYCGTVFEPGEIGEWVDGVDGNGVPQTALCPHCGIDSVIGSASGFPVTPVFLMRMRSHWFGAA